MKMQSAIGQLGRTAALLGGVAMIIFYSLSPLLVDIAWNGLHATAFALGRPFVVTIMSIALVGMICWVTDWARGQYALASGFTAATAVGSTLIWYIVFQTYRLIGEMHRLDAGGYHQTPNQVSLSDEQMTGMIMWGTVALLAIGGAALESADYLQRRDTGCPKRQTIPLFLAQSLMIWAVTISVVYSLP